MKTKTGSILVFTASLFCTISLLFAQEKGASSGIRTPIPIKTGNLSVDLLKAAASNMPPPATRDYKQFIDECVSVGISSVEDYITWLPLEPERDSLQWEFYDRNARELQARGLGYTVYPWLHFVPPWVLTSEYWYPLLCMEHGESTFAPSIWAPSTITLFDRFYKKLAEHFGKRISAIYVSMVCDYGEVGYPIGLADWVVPAKHKHGGYWCGDAHARESFAAFALERYRSLPAVNAAWGTEFTDKKKIDHPLWLSTEGPKADYLASLSVPERTQARTRWLDFCSWYLGSMVDFAGKATAVSRTYFPGIPHEIKVGFGNERVMYGADYTGCVARSKTAGFTVRSTHGKLPLYFYRRFSTAAKFYGTSLVTEPPSDVSRNEEIERIYKDAISGTKEFFDYKGNLLRAKDIFARYGRYMEGEYSFTDIAFFFPTTDHRLRAGQQMPVHLKAACDAAVDLFDHEIADERLVEDGVLAAMRTLIIPEGTVFDPHAIDRIVQWVKAGGVLIAADRAVLEMVDGTRTPDTTLFPQRASLPASTDIWPITDIGAAMVDIGAEHDTLWISGDWHGRESGHWEWGGKPDAIKKRWTGSNAHVKVFVDPTRENTIAISIARHPGKLSSRCEIFINGASAGSVSNERRSMFRAAIGSAAPGKTTADIEIRAETWDPRELDAGSRDTRILGVAVDWVKCYPSTQDEPAEAPPPSMKRKFNAARSAACIVAIGKGASVLLPVDDIDHKQFIHAVSAVVHGKIALPMRYAGVPVADGIDDGVWCALLAKRILICNTNNTAVEKRFHIAPEALARAGAQKPEKAMDIDVSMQPHSLAAIELPECRVVYP
ncbi:MAG: family 14 glycosylhydrolase [Spirochaetota bacterium]